jgi:oligopeptide transport system substrate-binding protein
MLDKYKDKSKTYMNGAIDWLRLNTKAAGKPWLANTDFRRALNYALNREDFIKSATNNLYLPFTRLVLPMVAGANGGKYTDEAKIDVYPTKGDAAKAKEYLQKAMTALKITDAKQMTLEIKTSDDENSKKAVQIMQDQLQKNLGITVTLKFVTYKQKLDDDTKGQYDAVVNGWMPDYDDPMTYMELFEGTNSSNSTGWKNADFDNKIEAARVEPDKVKRQQLFYDAEKILVDEGVGCDALRELAIRAAAEEQAMIDAFRPQSTGPAPTAYWRKKNAAMEKL